MDQPIDYIAFAIPVFFLLIGVELLIMKLGKSDLYRFNDAITNLSCGITSQVFGVFIKTIVVIGYVFLYENIGKQWAWPTDKWWTWVILLFGVDFFYYWFHRYSHEISFIWGTHVVHHQSEEYNLSVALRQSAFQPFFSSIFYLPLAIMGFDPIMFIVVNQFQTLYQFWIHTRTIGKLGPLEWVMNTPSHHRVHHGKNPKYIDKNHGGTFIIWDRLFGTFQEEEEEPVYGITTTFKSWNPIWANFRYYRDAFSAAVKTKNWGDKFRIFLKGPGWRPADLGGWPEPAEINRDQYEKFDSEVPKGLNYYVLFQYVLILGGASLFLFFSKELEPQFGKVVGWIWKIGLAAIIFVSVMNLGGLFELKKWAIPLEYMRVTGLAIMLGLLFFGTSYFIPVVVGTGIVLLVSFLSMFQFRRAFG